MLQFGRGNKLTRQYHSLIRLQLVYNSKRRILTKNFIQLSNSITTVFGPA
jgi:hypothetical protein